MTKSNGPLRRGRSDGAGSGVASNVRLAEYSSSDAWPAAGRLSLLPFDGRRASETSLSSRLRWKHGNASRYERLFLQGVGRPFLPGEAAGKPDAALLRRASPDC